MPSFYHTLSSVLVSILFMAALPLSAEDHGPLDEAGLHDAIAPVIAALQQTFGAGSEVSREAVQTHLDAIDGLIARLDAETMQSAAPQLRDLQVQILVMVKAQDEAQALLRRSLAESSDVEAQIGLHARLAGMLAEAGDEEGLETQLETLRGGDFPPELVAHVEGLRANAGLQVGRPFPTFAVTGTDGQPIDLADLRGQVVLIDFWASWCGPCVTEMPYVVAAYEEHGDEGFTVIGISLDDDRAQMDAFIAEHGMSWPQYFDGRGWENLLSRRFGISSIPATYLLDREGLIIGRDLRGDALSQAVAAAVAP